MSTTQTASPGGSAPSRARTGWRFLRGRRLTSWTELRRLLVSLLLSFLVLSFTIWVMPGVTASAHVDVLLAAAALGVLAALVGPLVTSFALLLGWVGVLLAAVFAEAVFFYVALSLTPGITVGGFWDVFWSSWIYSLLMTVVTWLVSAGDDTAFLSYLLRQSRRSGPTTAPPTTPGVVFVQVDGLPGPLLRWALQSGDLPTLEPVGALGQPHRHHVGRAAALDHPGEPGGAAARRERADPRVPVVREGGRPAAGGEPPARTPHTIQQRLTDGRGLLADGGASICNMFSGDAPTALLTMSSVTRAPGAGARPAATSRSSSTRTASSRALVLAVGRDGQGDVPGAAPAQRAT